MCVFTETDYPSNQPERCGRGFQDWEVALEVGNMSRNAIRSLILLTPPCLAAWWIAGLAALWMAQAFLNL